MDKEIIDMALVIIQIASLIALVIYVIKTWEMASATKKSAESAEKTLHEIKETRDQESAPYVVVYFDIPFEKHYLISLVIKNIGKTIAKNVKLNFTPPLQNSHGKEIGEIPLIKNGISSIPPGSEIRAFLDSTISYFNDQSLPLHYIVDVSYFGGLNEDIRLNQQTLDLSAYKDLEFIDEKGLHELVKEVESIAKLHSRNSQTLEKISENLKDGIRIKNPDFIITNLSSEINLWKYSVLAKLKEFGIIWTSFYSKKKEKLIDPFISDSQTKYTIISEQILIMLTNSPDTVSKEVLDDLIDIAVKLSELGRFQFYIDGGMSVKKFNELGDEINNKIESTLCQLRKY